LGANSAGYNAQDNSFFLFRVSAECDAEQCGNNEIIMVASAGGRNVRRHRRRVAEAITGEITTGRVIARLNGTITGLI